MSSNKLSVVLKVVMKVIAIEQIRVDAKRLCKFNDTVATAEVREMQQYVF